MMKTWLQIPFFAAVTACMSACSGSGAHRPLDASGTATAQGGGIGYNDVKPIFQKYCSACHPAKSRPDWLNYQMARTFAKNGMLSLRIMTQKSMPPPGSPEAAAITEQDREKLDQWAKAGGPETAGEAGGGAGTKIQGDDMAGPAQSCMSCHGPNAAGDPAQPHIPALAGQNAAYLRLQLMFFKWRERIDPNADMNNIATTLSSRDIESLAEYLSHLGRFEFISSAKPQSIAEASFTHGRQLAGFSCNSCHGASPQGDTSDDLVPRIQGQSREYIMSQLIAFRRGERRNNIMQSIARKLSDQDIEDLSVYFSSATTKVQSQVQISNPRKPSP